MNRQRSVIASAVFLVALGWMASLAASAAEVKVLTQARAAPFTSLDPQSAFEQTAADLTLVLYDTLLAYSYLERPYKLEPALLSRMPELSQDGLTYTLTLRKGVVFHDNPCFPGGKGRELTSDDVLYTLKRYADANVNHKSWFALEGSVAGLDDFHAATIKAGTSPDYAKVDIAGLKTIDRYSISVRLTHENPLFLFGLAITSMAIVPFEAVKFYGMRFDVNPVGTGPFTLQGPVDRKGVLRLLKNPKYFGAYPATGAPGDAEKQLLKAGGTRLPIVDVVEMPLIEEAQPESLRFLKGEIDWRAIDRANFTRMVVRNGDGTTRLADEFGVKFDLYSTPGIDMYYLAFNLKDSLLGKNKKLRQALAHLVDTQAYIDVLLNGRGRRLNSIVPYDLPGNERETSARARSRDLAAAKRLLAEAGYADGKGLPPLAVSFSSTTAATHDRFGQMKAKFAEAGVQLTPVFMDGPTFVKNVEGSNFQLAEYNWLADYPDAEDFYQLLYSKNAAPGSNLSSFANTTYDRAYEASHYMVNGPERLRHFKTMNAIIDEEVPIVVEFNSVRFGLTQKWVSNFKRNLLASELPFIDIDMTRKKKGL